MRIALLSDADTPGVFHHVPGDWQVNGVEGLAWALGGDVWHGTKADAAFCATLTEQYDLVIVNMKHTLWSALPELRRSVKKALRFVGYQEGPTDLIATLGAKALNEYRAALAVLDGMLLYDGRGLALHRLLAPPSFPLVERIACLPLPAPLEVYERYHLPYDKRPEDPVRVAVGPSARSRRGTNLSILLASRSVQDQIRIVVEARSIEEAADTSRYIAELCQVPDVHPWLPWAARRFSETSNAVRCPRCGVYRPGTECREHPTFLRVLSQCRLAVYLDPLMCYGRFLVDCAGLRIPVVTSGRQALAQHIKWPLTYVAQTGPDQALVPQFIVDGAQFADQKHDELTKHFHRDVIVARWRAILDAWGWR